jgi:uncharacterized protein (TIGR03437 family)
VINRLNLLLSKVAFGAILLFLVSSSAFAQVNYSITGTLVLTSAPSTDPLNLNGQTVTATATISQSATPTSSTTTGTSSSNSYGGVTVGLGIPGLGTIMCSAATAGPVTVTLTDTVSGPDTLGIENCNVAGIATITATATIANGNMITALPADIPTTALLSGTISFQLPKQTGSFNLTNATIQASGTVPPSVTPSLTSWTPPTVPVGSTTSESTQVTFTTLPSNSYDAVSFTASSSASWLTVTPAAANTFSGITLTANPTGLTQLVNNATVTLSYGTGYPTLQIPVTFNLAASTITLTAPSSMTFNYTPGGTAPPSQQLAIGAGSATLVNAAVTSGSSWLSVSPGSGTTPFNFTVSINPTGITTGPLNGNIQITASGVTNSPLNIPVTLNVSASTLTVPTTPLTFNYTTGGTAPAAQAVSISGTSGISFSASAATTSGGSWLSVTPASGTVSATSSVSISVNTTGLAAGSYGGTVTVTSAGATGSPAAIPVTLNVTAVPLTVSPSQLTFSSTVGGAQPASQSISVGDTSNAKFTATAATTSGGSWLSVTPGSGAASASLSVSVNTTGLSANTYNGTITIAATGATSQAVNVSLVVASATGPTISTVVSGASYATTGFAPGTIATIFGNLLGPANGESFSLNSSGGLNSTLGGVTVTVEGAPAIPTYVSNGQVNFILPFSLSTSGQAAVQVEYNKLTSVQFNIPLVPADVQIFSLNGSGSGPGAILNQDFSVNTASNPAAPGSVIQIYGTGGGILGGTTKLGPTVTAGGVGGDTLSWIPLPYSATVNGETATVDYAGDAPGLVYGVDQFNVTLPANTPSGAQRVVLTVGGSTSQSDVTVFVK